MTNEQLDSLCEIYRDAHPLGWGVFLQTDGTYRLQSTTQIPDGVVLSRVVRMARDRDLVATNTLRFLRTHSPNEYIRVLEYHTDLHHVGVEECIAL